MKNNKKYVKPNIMILKFDSSEVINTEFAVSAAFGSSKPKGIGSNSYSSFINF